MAFDVINTGTTANDGTGDPLRTAFTKVNDNTAKAVEGAASSTDGTVVTFDGTTGKVVKASSKVTADLVTGPASATSGNVAAFNGTTGKVLQDTTKVVADIVTGPASATSGNVAAFDGTSGKLLQNTTKVVADIVTGPASATSGRVAVYNGTTGKLLQDGTKAEADLVIGPASATDGRVAVFDQTTGKLLKDGTKAEADLVVGPASATDGAVALYDQTTGKLLKDGPVPGAASGLATLSSDTRVIEPSAFVGHRSLSHSRWLSPVTFGGGTCTLANGALKGIPWYLPFNLPIDRIGILVTTAGAAGSIVRLGVYGAVPTGVSLLHDFGTVATDTTGEKVITVDVTLLAGMVFLACVAQGAPASDPIVRGFGTGGHAVYGAQTTLTRTLTTDNTHTSLQTGVTGALPAGPMTNQAGASSNNYPGIAVRRKSL